MDPGDGHSGATRRDHERSAVAASRSWPDRRHPPARRGAPGEAHLDPLRYEPIPRFVDESMGAARELVRSRFGSGTYQLDMPAGGRCKPPEVVAVERDDLVAISG